MDTTIQKVCSQCCKTVTLHVNMQDVVDYTTNDVLAQDAFPYLSDDEREILISGWCSECFDKAFGEPETDLDNN